MLFDVYLFAFVLLVLWVWRLYFGFVALVLVFVTFGEMVVLGISFYGCFCLRR